MKDRRSLADVLPRDGETDPASGAAAVRAIPLARRADFKLGAALVRPSVRTVEGPGGSVTAEPRVMQVLLALVDADASVLTREDLLRICWGGTIVGDDSINRAIAEIRRIARTTGGGFGVETIPRIGYRLSRTDEGGATPAPGIGRRRLFGRALAAAAAAGAGVWIWYAPRANPRVAMLMEHGRQAIRLDMPDSRAQGVNALREAVALDPANAEAWGLLALALRNAAENAPAQETTTAVEACEGAARRALKLDPRQGDALAALASLRPYFGEWLASEDELLAVLKVAPDNVAAMNSLVTLQQSAGRTRDSWAWNERAAALDPLSPVPQYRKALKLWIMGRVPDADLAIERALQLWPRHPAVWNARLMTFGFTGRTKAALAMLDDEQARPSTLKAPAIAQWRASFTALDRRSPSDVAKARKVNTEAATRSPGFAVHAIMVLSALGAIDDAFDVADGYLLRRGPLIGNLWTGAGQMPVNDLRWRRTMMLWTPPSAAMRADPRFADLCRGIGLVDYWRRRGVGPDEIAPGLMRAGVLSGVAARAAIGP